MRGEAESENGRSSREKAPEGRTVFEAVPGRNRVMGDSAEFQKLSALEARLAAALERISRGLAERQDAADPGAESERAAEIAAMRAAAETQARSHQEAMASLQDELRIAQGASTEASERIAELEEVIAGLQAERDAAKAAEAAAASRIAELEQSASETDEDAASKAELEREITILKRRVERARTERDEALAARDAARDAAEELAASGGGDADAPALRAELRGLQATLDALSSELAGLRSGAGGAEGINRALEAQVTALLEARSAEAAELVRIAEGLSAALAASHGDPLGEAEHA